MSCGAYLSESDILERPCLLKTQKIKGLPSDELEGAHYDVTVDEHWNLVQDADTRMGWSVEGKLRL